MADRWHMAKEPAKLKLMLERAAKGEYKDQTAPADPVQKEAAYTLISFLTGEDVPPLTVHRCLWSIGALYALNWENHVF
jgi:hypothetical protein